MKTCKIVVADPSTIVMCGLTSMLKTLPDVEVVLQTDDLRAAASRLPIIHPDLLIVNPSMIDFSKRKMVRSLFEDLPDMKLVALVSSFFESQVLRQFNGVLEINDDMQRIKSTLNAVLSANDEEDEESDTAQLSDREKEVLVGLAKGLRNQDIADTLNISVHTVVTHRKNIVKKTGIKSVAALTVYAILNNLIEEKDIL